MKIKFTLLLLCSLCIQFIVQAQDLSGSYHVSGYFFHPTGPRALALSKTVTQVGPNTYQVNTLGDLSGWGFQFTVDASNNLVNWVAFGSTPQQPASGFMTTDNPGGFAYPGPSFPGTEPWIHAAYNNKYDPATKTFYMHYGYNGSAVNQFGYDRQIYEQYVFTPTTKITTVTPLTGTAFTEVTITGENLFNVDPANFSVYFAGSVADTIWSVSDHEIHAKVGSGGSGMVYVSDMLGKRDSFPGFVYTPVPPVVNSGWNYLGSAGFSSNRASYVSAASGSNSVPYVCYVDSASGRARVMKFNGNNWVGVGPFVSDGGSGYADIAITKNNVPVVAYADLHTGGITVKTFASGNWVTLGNASFIPFYQYSQSPFSMALDTSDVPCVLAYGGINFDLVTVFRLKAGAWVRIGDEGFAVANFQSANIAIDKLTNTPYVAFTDAMAQNAYGGNEASAMKFNGRKWVAVGNAGFSQTRHGAFYVDITVDSVGRPLVALQEDDGFERMTVYRFGAGNWSLVGPQRFSKSRSYQSSITLDKKGVPYVLFYDGSYNKQGTLMRFSKSKGTWDTLGARGFIPFAGRLERHALFFAGNNKPLVAFADKNNGGRVSVMKYDGAEALVSNASSANNISIAHAPEFGLYPNPAHNQLTINLSRHEAVTALQVFDLNGRILIDKPLSSAGNNTVTLDISKLTTGSYMLSIKTVNGLYNKKFIKQ